MCPNMIGEVRDNLTKANFLEQFYRWFCCQKLTTFIILFIVPLVMGPRGHCPLKGKLVNPSPSFPESGVRTCLSF